MMMVVDGACAGVLLLVTFVQKTEPQKVLVTAATIDMPKVMMKKPMTPHMRSRLPRSRSFGSAPRTSKKRTTPDTNMNIAAANSSTMIGWMMYWTILEMN